jgi:hypothetical protein
VEVMTKESGIKDFQFAKNSKIFQLNSQQMVENALCSMNKKSLQRREKLTIMDKKGNIEKGIHNADLIDQYYKWMLVNSVL